MFQEKLFWRHFVPLHDCTPCVTHNIYSMSIALSTLEN